MAQNLDDRMDATRADNLAEASVELKADLWATLVVAPTVCQMVGNLADSRAGTTDVQMAGPWDERKAENWDMRLAAPKDEQTAVLWDDSTAASMAAGKDKQTVKWVGWRGELTVESKAAWLVDMTAGCWAELTGTRWAAWKA
jgi:hypothetical protein